MLINSSINRKRVNLKNYSLIGSFIFLLAINVSPVKINLLMGCQGKERKDSNISLKDVSSIDSIIKAVYESITFSKGQQPDLNRFQLLFTVSAQLIRFTEEESISMNLNGFITSFRERIKNGKLVSFYEAEVSRKENTFGKIAQVFSTYTKCMNKEVPVPQRTGVNSFQLFFDGTRWWICSLLWQDIPSN